MLRCIYTALGSKGPQWGSVDILCPSVYLYLFLSLSLSFCPVLFVTFWQTFEQPVIARSAYNGRPQVFAVYYLQ